MRASTIKSSLLTAAAFIITSFTGRAAAELVTIEPQSLEIHAGSTFTVDITASQLEASTDIGAFDIDLVYDNAVFEFAGYALYDGLGSVGTEEVLDLGGLVEPGKLNLAAVSQLAASELNNQPNQDLKLAAVTFRAIDNGTSELQLSVNYLSDAFGEELAASSRNGTVNSVPEPAMTAMLLMGAFMLTANNRKRKHSTDRR